MSTASAEGSGERLRFLEREGPQALAVPDKAKTLVIIPFAPVEFHGPHLPLSTDLILAAQFSRGEAEEFLARNPSWYALVYPVIPLGTDLVPHAGSVAVPIGVIYRAAVSVGRHFVRQGFVNLVFQSGHGGINHDRALERAARTLSRRYRKRNVRAVAPLGPVMMKLWGAGLLEHLNPLLEQKIPAEHEKDFLYETHGGWWETSMVLYHRPDLMSESYRRVPDYLPPVKAWARLLLGAVQRILPGKYREMIQTNRPLLEVGLSWFWAGTAPGYHGFPSRANVDMGRGSTILAGRVFADFLERFFIQGADLAESRSLYSLFDVLRWYGLGAGAFVLMVIALVVFL